MIGDVPGKGPIERDADLGPTLAYLHAIIADVDNRLYDAGAESLTEEQKARLLERSRYAEARDMIEVLRDSGHLSETLLGRLIRAHADHHGVADPTAVSSWPK